MKKTFLLSASMLVFLTCSGQNNAVMVPVVTGPVNGPGHIFCTSSVDLSPLGYVEEEYFLEGKARRYNFDSYPANAKPIDTLYHYKTRMIVRRPADMKKFNGTVVVEWLNVSSMYDVDSDWSQLRHHLIRSGYVWVGVSVQRAGIHSPKGLRSWNPARYGSLDVTADSTMLYDQLCFDIFSQAVAALKGSQEVRPLGNLIPKVIIATGHSQSALILTAYYNSIQPVSSIIDGFIIRGGGDKLRTDIQAKAMRINAETDLIELGMVVTRQPDTDRIVSWEISGTSHADQTFLDYHSFIATREFGSYTPPQCNMPLCSLIPFYYAYAAALDHMDRWIREGITPPSGVLMAVMQTNPMVVIERDSLGNALGGIRLPQFAVPVAMNSGINSGEGFCRFYGTHKEFDQQTLFLLYPTHKIYMKQFRESVLENLKAGYIISADTTRMMNEARSLSSLWIE